MPHYTRAWVPGGSFFFTVALLERRRSLLVQHIGLLREAFHKVRVSRPFRVDAAVVLPDHLHCIWSLPPGERLSARRQRKGERGIWQRRFWEHCLRDEQDFERHVDYIHYNPVKHGYVQAPGDWPHSSFHRYVQSGIFAADWAASREIRDVERE